MDFKKLIEKRIKYNNACLSVLDGWKYTGLMVEELVDTFFPWNNIVGYDKNVSLVEFIDTVKKNIEDFNELRFAQSIYGQLETDPTSIGTDYFYEEPDVTYKRISKIKI